jgi:hypothetical protein
MRDMMNHTINLPGDYSGTRKYRSMYVRGRCAMEEQRWDDERANHLLDAARVVLEAAGGWQMPEDDHGDDPASLLRFAELYFSEGVRRGIWPHVDLMNRGIRAGDLEDLRLGVLGLLRVILCTESGLE